MTERSDIRRRLVIRGQVQGVFFRAAVRERAQAAGVSGSARNLPDGAVEIVLEGPVEAVEQVQRFCETGPQSARVEAVDSTDECPQYLAGGFQIS